MVVGGISSVWIKSCRHCLLSTQILETINANICFVILVTNYVHGALDSVYFQREHTENERRVTRWSTSAALHPHSARSRKCAEYAEKKTVEPPAEGKKRVKKQLWRATEHAVYSPRNQKEHKPSSLIIVHVCKSGKWLQLEGVCLIAHNGHIH